MRIEVNPVDRKIVPPDQIAQTADLAREKGLTIATLNGSFDLLHAGHLHILYEAAKAADRLIVLLNTDRSIKQYKSPDRPIIPLEYRMQMMAAIECVDYVSSFNETDPRKALTAIKPDVHINGAEYGKDCIEADTVRKYGGTVKIVPLVPGLSTSEIVRKIQCG